MKTLALARLALLACCGAVALAPGVAAGHGRMLAAHTAAGSSAEDYVSADAESAVVYSDVLPHEISRDQFLDIFLTSLVGMMIVITFWELLVGSTPLGQIFPTAAFSLFLGMLFGYLMRVLDLDEAERQIMNFSNRLFLFVLLPPIIYESAFMMDRKTFFHNCGTVMLIVVPGVVLSTAIIGYTTYLFGSLGAFTHDGLTPLDFSSPLQPMLFGSLISATDPVATLAILSTVEIPPVLFVLIFGESLLNDAVSIVLYKVLKWYGKEAFQWAMLPVVIGDFLAISLGSVLVGAGVGLLSAYLHRQLIERTFHSPSGEMTSVILFGYIAYTLAESVNLSGITALVVAGICQRYYTFYSISHEAQHASHHVLKLIASKAEQFVFLYLGINVFLVSGEADLASESVRRVWGADMVIFAAFMLALVMAARLIMVVSMCALANTQRSKKIGLNEMVLMWWAGLRGAMAFALAKDLENEMIVSLTIVVVLFTTFVCGCSTAYVVKRLGLVKAAAPTTLAAQIAALPSELPAIPLPPLAGRPPSISRRTSYAVPLPQQKHRQRAWDLFDKKYMRPIFGGPGIELHHNQQGTQLAATLSTPSDMLAQQRAEAIETGAEPPTAASSRAAPALAEQHRQLVRQLSGFSNTGASTPSEAPVKTSCILDTAHESDEDEPLVLIYEEAALIAEGDEEACLAEEEGEQDGIELETFHSMPRARRAGLALAHRQPHELTELLDSSNRLDSATDIFEGLLLRARHESRANVFGRVPSPEPAGSPARDATEPQSSAGAGSASTIPLL